MANKYRAWVDGETLTAANLIDYVQKNVVIPCDSSADYPDSSTRREGMTVYDKNADKLLTYTTSTTGWVAPWNMPWGLVHNTNATSQVTSSGTTPLALITSGSFTAVANRYYRVRFNTGLLFGNTAGDLFDLTIRLTSTSGTVVSNAGTLTRYYAKGYGESYTMDSGPITLTAGATVLVVTATRNSGTGTIGTSGSGINYSISVDDIGPSGAPA